MNGMPVGHTARAFRIFGLYWTMLFIWLANAEAFSPAKPTQHDVISPNGKYIATVDPERQKITVFQKSPKKTLWTLNRPVAIGDEFYLSDSGQMVAAVTWRFIQIDNLKQPALTVYGSAGVQFSNTYRALSRLRRLSAGEVGPIGSFWRVWRGDVRQDGNTLSIPTIGRTLTLQLK